MKTIIIAFIIICSNQLLAQCIKGDCKNGYGIRIDTAHGEKYEGNFVNGEFEGKGVFEDRSSKYDGNWKDGWYDGFGKYTYINHYTGKPEISLEYTGYYKNGKKEGEGIFVYYLKANDTSFMYKGNFKDDHYFGKGTYVIGNTAIIKSDNWIDNQNCTNATEYRPKTNETSTGNYVALNFVRDKPLKEDLVSATTTTTAPDGPDHFKSIAQRMADINAGKMERHGSPIKHAERIVNLAQGQYSEIIKYGMMGYYYSGFKRYFISPTLYSKKYPIPFGARFIYQLVNDKNELINTQEKFGNELECYFDIPVDGDYTIQVAYDFSGCAGCQQVSGLRVQFGLYSQDFDKKQ